MKDNTFFAVKRYHYFKAAVLLCLLCSLVISACVTNTPTPTPTMAMPIPTIISSCPCELAPGDTFPLSVTGVFGSGVSYSWSASKGIVEPSEGPSVLYTAPDTGGNDIVRVEARKDGQSAAATITCVVSTPVTPTPTSSPTPTATLTPTISPTPTPTPTPTITLPPAGDNEEIKAAYSLCEDEEGKIIGTLYATGGNGGYSYSYATGDNGEYSNAPSGVFEAQIDEPIKLAIKSSDGQTESTIIHLDADKGFPSCGSAISMRTAFLEVEYFIVPCWRGGASIKVVYSSTKGGDGEYSYDPSEVFDVQIGDTKTLVVKSEDGQIWTDNLYVSRNLMRSCISVFEDGDGDGDGNGRSGADP